MIVGLEAQMTEEISRYFDGGLPRWAWGLITGVTFLLLVIWSTALPTIYLTSALLGNPMTPRGITWDLGVFGTVFIAILIVPWMGFYVVVEEGVKRTFP